MLKLPLVRDRDAGVLTVRLDDLLDGVAAAGDGRVFSGAGLRSGVDICAVSSCESCFCVVSACEKLDCSHVVTSRLVGRPAEIALGLFLRSLR